MAKIGIFCNNFINRLQKLKGKYGEYFQSEKTNIKVGIYTPRGTISFLLNDRKENTPHSGEEKERFRENNTGKATVIKGYNTMGKKGSELGYIFRWNTYPKHPQSQPSRAHK